MLTVSVGRKVGKASQNLLQLDLSTAAHRSLEVETEQLGCETAQWRISRFA